MMLSLRFELKTSRLLNGCSNQLSYESSRISCFTIQLTNHNSLENNYEQPLDHCHKTFVMFNHLINCNSVFPGVAPFFPVRLLMVVVQHNMHAGMGQLHSSVWLIVRTWDSLCGSTRCLSRLA